MSQGDPVSLAAALEAYNEAIARLRPLICGNAPVNPSWVNSLGAALMNRGHLLHRVHGINQATLALEAYTEAATLLRPLAPPSASTSFSPSALQPSSLSSSPWPRRNLTGTHLNCANLLLDLAQYAAAGSNAREALTLALPHEASDRIDAELSLKARRAACDAIGHLITDPTADLQTLATEGSDLVDDALAVTRRWATRGETIFQPLALRFFRFGVQLYRFHQPHFLAEFIRENLPFPQAEFRLIALEAIDATLTDRPAEFLTVGDPASERRLEAWRELASLRVSLVA